MSTGNENVDGLIHRVQSVQSANPLSYVYRVQKRQRDAYSYRVQKRRKNEEISSYPIVDSQSTKRR